MNVQAKLDTRTSKAGKPYKAIVIKLTDNYEKLVFLTKAEEELLQLNEKK